MGHDCSLLRRLTGVRHCQGEKWAQQRETWALTDPPPTFQRVALEEAGRQGLGCQGSSETPAVDKAGGCNLGGQHSPGGTLGWEGLPSFLEGLAEICSLISHEAEIALGKLTFLTEASENCSHLSNAT